MDENLRTLICSGSYSKKISLQIELLNNAPMGERKISGDSQHNVSVTTFTIMTLILTVFSIMVLSVMTVSIMVLSVMTSSIIFVLVCLCVVTGLYARVLTML